MFHHQTEYTLQKIFISPKHISSLCNILSKILHSEQSDVWTSSSQAPLPPRPLLYSANPCSLPIISAIS